MNRQKPMYTFPNETLGGKGVVTLPQIEEDFTVQKFVNGRSTVIDYHLTIE